MKLTILAAVFAAIIAIGLAHSITLGRSLALRGRILSGHTSSEITFEVVNNTSIAKEVTKDCLCEEGQFWHWRIKQCINQGAWGYECGFFPAEHHRFVCADGLECRLVNGTTVKYQHEGAVPATCRRCGTDQCETGAKRHQDECLKETKLSGDARATVRVTVVAEATAEVTKEHSVAEQTASATAVATADGEGVGEGSAIVTIEEVKAAMGLKKDQRVGPVLSAKIVSTGDKMAFDRAYEAALQNAVAAGALDAKDAAEKLASTAGALDAKEAAEKLAGAAGALDAKEAAEKLAGKKAEADAKLEAKAKAAEDEAWKAEAGADAAAANEAVVPGMGPPGMGGNSTEAEPAEVVETPQVPRKVSPGAHAENFP